MVTPEQIETWIRAGLPCDHLRVVGDGQHFEAVIVSAEFRGKLPVARHQSVYQALGSRMQTDIHALSMQTLTPEEWASRAPGSMGSPASPAEGAESFSGRPGEGPLDRNG